MSLPIIKHNPAFLTDRELKERFVVRLKELDLLLDCIRSNTGDVNQHVIVIAPRGMGKTMLMRRTALEVNGDPVLSRRWLPVILPEESYSVATEGEFWLRVLTYAAPLSGESRWEDMLGHLRGERDEFRLRSQSIARLRELSESLDRRLLVVVENMNILLGEQARNKTGWDLRKTLLGESCIMLAATATTHFDEIKNANKAMYELFREIKLPPISTQECRILWQAVTGETLEGIRVRPLEILTGGNPRLLSILGSFSVGTSFRRIMEDLIVLIDDHTTYFKSNVESLAPLERRVFASLAEIWEPAGAREVADLARLEVSETSSLLKRLVSRGAVVVTGRTGRKAFYQVADRLYNIYHIMRQSGSTAERARAAVDFMVKFYSPDYLAQCIAEEACRIDPEVAGLHIEAYRHILHRFSDRQMEVSKIVSATPEKFYRIPGLPEDLIEQVNYPQHSSSRAEHSVVKKALQPDLAEQPPSEETVKNEIETLFLQARKRAESNSEQALELYDQIVKKYEKTEDSHRVAAVARAMVYKGVTLGALGRSEEEVAVYDQVVERFEDSHAPELLEQVARAMVNKGFRLGALGRSEEEVASYDAVLQFGNKAIPSVRMLIFNAAIKKSMILIRLDRNREASQTFRLLDRECKEPAEYPTESLIDSIVDISAEGFAEAALEMLLKSEAKNIVEPLVVALKILTGKRCKAPQEVAEVARDVVDRIRRRQKEFKIRLNSAASSGMDGGFQPNPPGDGRALPEVPAKDHDKI